MCLSRSIRKERCFFEKRKCNMRWPSRIEVCLSSTPKEYWSVFKAAIVILFGMTFLSVNGECLEINGVAIYGEEPYSDDEIIIANSDAVSVEPNGVSRMVGETIEIHPGFHAKEGCFYHARAAINPDQDTIIGVHGSERSNPGTTHPTYVDYPELFVFGRHLPGGAADSDPSNPLPNFFCPWSNNKKGCPP